LPRGPRVGRACGRQGAWIRIVHDGALVRKSFRALRSTLTPLRRRCRRRRLPSRSATRGCRASGPRIGSGAGLAPATAPAGSGVDQAARLVGRALRQKQREGGRGACGAEHLGELRERGSGEPGQALSFSVRVHPLTAALFLCAAVSRTLQSARTAASPGSVVSSRPTRCAGCGDTASEGAPSEMRESSSRPPTSGTAPALT
jgi:hypothetical protein